MYAAMKDVFKAYQTATRVVQNGVVAVTGRRPLMTTAGYARSQQTCRDGGSIKWNVAVAEADKLLGYPKLLIPGIPRLGHDVFAPYEQLGKKIAGTLHPLLETARNLLYNGEIKMQARGLITLLWAKGMATCEDQRDPIIIERERYIAAVTELLHTGHRIHSSVVNVKKAFDKDDDDDDDDDLLRQVVDVKQANKVAVLIGDLMIVKANVLFAKLESLPIYFDMSGSIRDYVRGEFMFDLEDDKQDSSTYTTAPFQVWETRTFLRNASLLANALKGVTTINGRDEMSKKRAYDFDKNMCMAWKASQEIQNYDNPNFEDLNSSSSNLISLPVVLHLTKNLQLLQFVASRGIDLSLEDYKEIRDRVLNGKAIDEARHVCNEFIRKAQDELNEVMPSSEPKELLHNMLAALQGQLIMM